MLKHRRTIERTERDIAIFDILQRYRYLPANFIWPLLPSEVQGRSYKRYVERLGTLFHEGYLNRPARQWQCVNARYKPCTYELDGKGKAVLSELGLRIPHRVGHGKNFSHELLVCLIQASLEISCREYSQLEYVSWNTILTYKTLPNATRISATPFKMPVTVLGKKRHLIPDGTPAGIWYRSDGGKRVAMCFVGFEADCATEPHEPLEIYERANTEFKLRAYLDIAAKKTYHTHFGFPNMVVPIVTTNAARLQNMMGVLEKLTNGKGASSIIFKSIPAFGAFEKSPQPSDLVLTTPWQRVGYTPLEVVSALEARANRR